MVGHGKARSGPPLSNARSERDFRGDRPRGPRVPSARKGGAAGRAPTRPDAWGASNVVDVGAKGRMRNVRMRASPGGANRINAAPRSRVSRLDMDDVGAHFRHDTGPFIAQDYRHWRSTMRAVDHVEAAVAYAAGDHAHANFALPGGVQLDVFKHHIG